MSAKRTPKSSKGRPGGQCTLEFLEPRQLFSTYMVGPSATYHTIQSAIDAVRASNPSNPDAVSNTIIVAPGTYTEQPYIPYVYRNGQLLKNLNIESVPTTSSGKTSFNNENTTIIKAPVPLVPFVSKTNVKYRTIIWDAGAINLKIQGFTITGPGGAGPGNIDYGILATGGTVTINSNHITQIHDNPINSYGHGDAIEIQDPTPGEPPTYAVIVANKIDHYQKAGISIDAHGNSEVYSNVVTGDGSSAKVGQNGIQVGNGGTANIHSNTVSQNAGHNALFTASGILLIGAGPTTVQSNIAFNNDANIVVDNSVSAKVYYNSVYGATYDGIDVFDMTTGADVSHNTSKNNTFDGIYVESGAHGNMFTYNFLQGNINEDEEDLSSGTKTGGTANTWQNNTFETSNPSGLQ